MRLLGKWLVDQFRKFDLLAEYFKAIAGQWMNILFGETIVGVVFLIWWALGSPPVVVIFVSGMLVAGYYAWRPSYMRMVPRLEICESRVQVTDTNDKDVYRAYIQVIPKCLTDAPVNGCKGHLLRVLRWSDVLQDWDSTEINEPLELLWSNYDNSPRTLQRGVDQRLNVFWRDNRRRMSLDAHPVPLRAMHEVNTVETYRFDIRITSADAPVTDVSLKIHLGESWDKPKVEILSVETTGNS